jgi:hypothetical protein
MYTRVIKYATVLIGLIYVIHSCKEKSSSFTRNSFALKQIIFYGIKEKNENDSLLRIIISDLDKVFKLPDLQVSNTQNEIRIFYMNASGSLFFQQQFTGDSTIADLYICSGENSNDSLFLKLHHKITVAGKHQYSNQFNAAGISDFFQQLEVQQEGILDNISQFTVQVKNGQMVKSFLIDKPFTIQPQTPESRYISKIVKQISEDFNFNFNGSVKGILDTAMTRPYGKECNK